VKTYNYLIEVKFKNKPSLFRNINCTDNTTALIYVLNSLSTKDKDNVIGVNFS
jgi:hypothetical protein